MAKILKTINADAALIIEETFSNEDQAAGNDEPEKREVKVSEIKINNTKWKRINE
jgi:hypothetical protein